MLVLQVKEGESVFIGDDIKVMFVRQLGGHRIRIGISAGTKIPVYREEIWNAIQRDKPVAKLGEPLRNAGSVTRREAH